MKRTQRNAGVLAITLAFFLAGMAVFAGGVAKTGEFYEVRVDTSGDSATITVTGKAGYHCNVEYPWKLTVASQGQQSVFKKGDAKTFSAQRVVFVAPFRKAATGELKMSLCDDKQCKIEKLALAW